MNGKRHKVEQLYKPYTMRVCFVEIKKLHRHFKESKANVADFWERVRGFSQHWKYVSDSTKHFFQKTSTLENSRWIMGFSLEQVLTCEIFV